MARKTRRNNQFKNQHLTRRKSIIHVGGDLTKKNISHHRVEKSAPKKQTWFNDGHTVHIPESVTRKASEKIANFFKSTETKRKRQYLGKVCNNASECIAFGKETETIRAFFKNFVDFNLVHGNIKRIGRVSANGFVFEITYKRDNYVSYAVLKSMLARNNADNLLYEYEVGLFVNQMSKMYSCFIETYALLQYRNKKQYDFFKSNDQITVNTNIQEHFTQNPLSSYQYNDLKIASPHVCILIQQIQNAIPLANMLRDSSFVKNDLLYVLIQIYFPLAQMHNVFTHYDLHGGNVLLYPISNGNYIDFNYTVNGTEVWFKCRYLAKIIDYGRSYFYKNEQKNSRVIYEQLKQHLFSIYEKTEAKDIKNQIGFEAMQGSKETQAFHSINSVIPNKTHDLRLTYVIIRSLVQNNFIKNLSNFWLEVADNIDYVDRFGSPSKDSDSSTGKICNVIDMQNILFAEILTRDNVALNISAFTEKKSVGVLIQDGINPIDLYIDTVNS